VYFISRKLKSHSILIQMVMFVWELKCHGEIICVSGLICALKTGMIMSNRHLYKITLILNRILRLVSVPYEKYWDLV